MIGGYGDDDFREKPSWRDRDRRKDRSSHVSQDYDAFSPHRSSRFRKEYLREANKLFEGGKAKKGNPEKEKARSEIHGGVGSKKFAPAVRRFLKKYGLPEDWGTLMLLLDYKDDSGVVLEALGRLKELYPDQGLEEQKGFRSKLNIISMTTKDEEVGALAEELVEELQGR